MLTAITESGCRVIAPETERGGTLFFCPECDTEVTLKKGTVITHHFAHKPPVTCLYGAGETEAHRKAKKEIYDALIYTGQAVNIEMEKSFGDVRADIYAVINGTPVAIEIQRSTLTPEDIVRRTSSYTEKGIHVLWLALDDGRIHQFRFIPKWWEKWLHAAYYGRVFYWHAGEYVIPVKFATAYTYVEATDWGGGYTKALRRYKEPAIGDCLSIANDLRPVYAQEWSGGSLHIPARLILSVKALEK